jgi:hypothetical protein
MSRGRHAPVRTTLVRQVQGTRGHLISAQTSNEVSPIEEIRCHVPPTFRAPISAERVRELTY